MSYCGNTPWRIHLHRGVRNGVACQQARGNQRRECQGVDAQCRRDVDRAHDAFVGQSPRMKVPRFANLRQ